MESIHSFFRARDPSLRSPYVSEAEAKLLGRMNARRRSLALRSNVVDVNERLPAQPDHSKFGARSFVRSFVRSFEGQPANCYK